jgi:hypothetical protein
MTAYIPEVERIAERNTAPQNRRISRVFIAIDLVRKETYC